MASESLGEAGSGWVVCSDKGGMGGEQRWLTQETSHIGGPMASCGDSPAGVRRTLGPVCTHGPWLTTWPYPFSDDMDAEPPSAHLTRS